MGELGGARHADLAQPLARRNRLAHRHRDGSLAQMSVGRVPAAAVVDHHHIAGVTPLDGVAVDVVDVDVVHAVAHRRDHAGRRRHHGNAARHVGKAGKPEVGAPMRGRGQPAAAVIDDIRSGVAIDIFLDQAADFRWTSHRRFEHGPIAGARHRGAGKDRQRCRRDQNPITMRGARQDAYPGGQRVGRYTRHVLLAGSKSPGQASRTGLKASRCS